VQVNCIRPSLVDTERQRRRIRAEMERSGRGEADIRRQFCAETGITRFGTPADMAGLVCFIVSRNGSWLHGATIDLDAARLPCFEI
jgi:3-oxoacyl-[acyl-carrier protein] reductase